MNNPKKIDPNTIETVIVIALAAAQKAREDAGFDGRYDDGGAREIENQIKFYNYGRHGVVPPEWNKYADQTDPEYATYQRLKQKFGNIG